MSDTRFNPRSATLNYAGKDDTLPVNAIACGLVYVGDQIGKANLLVEYQVLRDRIKDAVRTPDKAIARLRELEQELWPG